MGVVMRSETALWSPGRPSTKDSQLLCGVAAELTQMRSSLVAELLSVLMQVKSRATDWRQGSASS